MADVTFNGTTFTGEGTYDQAAGTADTPLTADLVVSGSSDSSTITLSGGVYTTGNLTHSKGILNIAEGSVNSCNNFGIQKGGANGTSAYIYGTVNANSLTLNKTGSCTAYLNISGNLTVSGNVKFNGAASGQGILTQTGGTVNFTTSTDQGIVIGHYETSANFPARYNLSNGTFNALNSTVYVGWNGPGELNVSGGEANLKGIQLVGGWNSTTGYAAAAKGTINLTGGKLNIGANGVTLKNSRHAINLGDGTIGALASHSWANTLTVTLTDGKTPTFDIDADKTITINSTVTGTGNLKKTGAGTLTLSKAPTYTGATTVSAGTLTLSAGGTLYNLSGGEVENGQITVPSSLTVAGKLTLNNDQLTKFIGSITAPTVEKTGLDTLQLCFDAQNAVSIGSLVVSSGRVDLKGYMSGNISVEGPDAVFSPGNSVGDARFGGGYELKEGATLLIEQDATGIDTLTASSFVIDDNSILELTMGSVQPGASYPIIFNTSPDGFQGDLATDNFWNGLLTPESANYWNLSVVNGNTVYASIDANAVPEPSTWALLLLGAAGLMYVRKRTRK